MIDLWKILVLKLRSNFCSGHSSCLFRSKSCWTETLLLLHKRNQHLLLHNASLCFMPQNTNFFLLFKSQKVSLKTVILLMKYCDFKFAFGRRITFCISTTNKCGPLVQFCLCRLDKPCRLLLHWPYVHLKMNKFLINSCPCRSYSSENWRVGKCHIHLDKVMKIQYFVIGKLFGKKNIKSWHFLSGKQSFHKYQIEKCDSKY